MPAPFRWYEIDVALLPQTLTVACTFHSTSFAKEALVLRKEHGNGEETDYEG